MYGEGISKIGEIVDLGVKLEHHRQGRRVVHRTATCACRAATA